MWSFVSAETAATRIEPINTERPPRLRRLRPHPLYPGAPRRHPHPHAPPLLPHPPQRHRPVGRLVRAPAPRHPQPPNLVRHHLPPRHHVAGRLPLPPPGRQAHPRLRGRAWRQSEDRDRLSAGYLRGGIRVGEAEECLFSAVFGQGEGVGVCVFRRGGEESEEHCACGGFDGGVFEVGGGCCRRR